MLPVPPGSAILWVWAADDLAAPRTRRGQALRPLDRQVVPPDSHVVVGRRESADEPARTSDGEGGLRLALEQQHRLTSRRHVRLERRGQWSLDVLPSAAPSAGIRAWGRLRWDDAEPGSRHPLSPGRPVAMLLAGSPAYVITIEPVSAREASPAGPPPTLGPARAPETAGSESGRTQRTDIETLEAPVTLSDQALVTVARIFRSALQWPPHSHDDPTPSWAGMPQDEALRASYRRLLRSALEPLGLPRDRGPDPELLARLIATGCLTWDHVAAVADACDLSFPTRRPAARPAVETS